MSFRLALCWGLCLALAACRGEPAPSAPVQVKFDLPAYKHMPACDLILQLHGREALPEPSASMALANAGYLAVRGCPAARAELEARGRITLPLRLSPGAGLLIETARLQPGALSEAGLNCLKEQLTGKAPDGVGGLDASATLTVQLKEDGRDRLP